MDEGVLQQRTKRFAVRVIQLVKICQRLRPGRSSVGSKCVRPHRLAHTAGQPVGRIHAPSLYRKLELLQKKPMKLFIWLELILESGLLPAKGEIKNLLQEIDELTTIFIATGCPIREKC